MITKSLSTEPAYFEAQQSRCRRGLLRGFLRGGEFPLDFTVKFRLKFPRNYPVDKFRKSLISGRGVFPAWNVDGSC